MGSSRPDRTRRGGRRVSEPVFQATLLLVVAGVFAALVAVRGGDQAGAATQDFGSIPVGSSITTNGPCGYAPSSTVTVSDGGASYNKTADAGGCIHVLIRVASQSQVVYDETITVTGTPNLCGANDFTANGTGPAAPASGGGPATGPGPAVSNTGTYNIPCPPTNPATTCPTPSSDTTNLGTLNVGQSVTTVVCGPWTPAQPVNLTLNNLNAGSKPANADGALGVAISILSANSVSVDDVVPSSCGTNTLRLTGPGFGGASITRTVLFSINCFGNGFGFGANPFLPNLFGNGLFGNALPFGSALPFSGFGQPGLTIAPQQANSQQQQEQQQSVSIPTGSSTPAAAAAPAAAAQGRVAFTGSRISFWLGAAILLVTLGIALLAPTPKVRRWLGFPVRD